LLLAAIIVYLLLTVFVGYLASRRVHTSSDFLLAGRSLPVMLSSTALFATWFGSETVFGASSEFLSGGLFAVIEDPFGASLCILLFGLFFARKLYNMNLLTLGDFFKARFGRRTELVASIFLAPPYVGYIAAQLVAMGIILNSVTGMELWQGVSVSALVVTIYTYIGGMWAITITDFVQTVIIIVGLAVLAVVLTMKAGGVDTVLNQVPPERLKFLPDGNARDVVAWLGAWSVLGLGSIPSQDVFQRSMSSASANVAVRSCYIAAALYLTVAMLPLYIALCGQYLFPELLQGDTQQALPTMVLQHTALPIQILFFGSLLSAIMSTTSSAILAPASICSENILKPLFNKQLSDRSLLLATRVFILIFAAIATVMAMLRSNIYELVGESSIFSLVSLFAPLAFGLYWKKANAEGALLSMVAGTVSWFIFEALEVSWSPHLLSVFVSMGTLVVGSLLSEKLKVKWQKSN